MHVRNGEVCFSHFSGEPLHLVPLIAEDHRLCDCQSVVKVAQGFELVVFLLNCYEELLDLIQGQFVSFDQDLQWIIHEFVGHVKDLLGQGR